MLMPNSLQTRPRWFLLSASRSSLPEPKSARTSWLVPAFVLVVAGVLASCLYIRFLNVERSLWYNPYHDRSAHYLYSLRLATDISAGRVFLLLRDLGDAKIWPPLHGMAAAVVQLVGGRDPRLGVLPSLAAWVATVLLAFLVARRAAPRGGTLAGLLAALFVIASPAARAYAADIMLESLGAALSLLVLYCYLLTVQGYSGDSSKARWLALSLLLLFLEKYNYWFLVAVSLLTAEAMTRPQLYFRTFVEGLRLTNWKRRLAAECRNPMTVSAVAVLVLSIYFLLRGERPIHIAGRSISLFPPHNVFYIAYVLFFVRLAWWWRREGRRLTERLDIRWRQIVLWLLRPLSLWFLLPKRPSYFVWYLSFADRSANQSMDILGGFRDYATWMVQDYHWTPACALAAAALCVVGLLSCRRLRPGGAAIVALVVLSSVLTPTHPNHKSRMMHSWIPAVWVMAGLGAAALVYGRGTARVPRLRPWLAGAAVGVAAWMQYPAPFAAAKTMEGGAHTEFPSMLDITDAYLPHVDGARRTLLLTTIPLKPMVQWTWLQRFGNFDRLEQRWYGFGALGEPNRRGFASWLATTNCDTVVTCETTIPRPGVDSGPECEIHAELVEELSRQTTFRLASERYLPHLGCRVRIWNRQTN
jgi:hypothetical protein